MRFKDLALFNDALLAKQAWRLLQNKNSLFYRVFKSKFFPHCSIMEVVDSQSDSYVRKSILKGREVLKEGMKWRVGGGSAIRIYSNPWLPSDYLPYISSPIVPVLEDAHVATIINPATNEWNFSILQEHFLPRGIALIESIPLSFNPVEDKLF